MRSRLAILLSILLLLIAQQGIALKKDSVAIKKKLVFTDIPAEQKVKYLNDLCSHYWYINTDTSLYYGWLGLPISNNEVSSASRGFLHFAIGMAWENKGNADSAMWYLCKSSGIFKEGGNKFLYFRSVEQIGSLYRILGKYDTAVVIISRSLQYFKSNNLKFQIMSALFNIGSVYVEQNRFNKALQYYLESQSYDSVLKDTNAMATNNLGLGLVYQNLGSLFSTINPAKSRVYFNLAEKEFRESHVMFQNTGHRTGVCFSNINLLSVLINKEEYNVADSLLKTDSYCLSFKDPRVEVSFMSSRALLLKARHKDSEALEVLSKVAAREGDMVILPEFHDAMLVMAELLRDKGLKDSAYHLARRSSDWAEHHSVYPMAVRANETISDWLLDDGKSEKAILSMKTASVYKDSLYRSVDQEIFDEVELKFKNQVLHAQVDLLSAEKDLQKSNKMIIILISVLVVLLLAGLLVYFIFRQKRAERERIIAQQRNLQLEQENKIKDSELERSLLEKKLREEEVESLHLEVDLREQDLVYQTLLRTDLSNVARSVNEKLSPFQYRLSKKKDQEDFSRTLAEIARDSAREPMQDFELLFRQMHSGFYEKLLERCPGLSKTELNVCALLRLNLSSKDISRIVNISSNTIDLLRHKIRKKLELEPKENLSGYLIML